MDRKSAIDRLVDNTEQWDLLIIGGGATGLGAALDAATRGYRVALIEQADFAQATSSRSTKLVHGGVRYLKQGNISLVRESLRERGLLFRNAPHLVSALPFAIPYYKPWEGLQYGIGLKMYDLLAGTLGIEKSSRCSVTETARMLPEIRTKGLWGSIRYFDGQFDDSRLAIDIARAASKAGGCLANYVKAVGIIKESERVVGVVANNSANGQSFTIRAKVVINATGVFADELRRKSDPAALTIIKPSRGSHIVVDGDLTPSKTALIVPKTTDGRVLFAIPWLGKTVIGTTDTPVDSPILEPYPEPEDIDFILENTNAYFTRKVERRDILSSYSGLRPLVVSKPGQSTSKISRNHSIQVSPNSLITVAGGKWTTYRKMAEDLVDRAEDVAQLEHRPCKTRDLLIDPPDSVSLDSILKNTPDANFPIHNDFDLTFGQAVWRIRNEMTHRLEDLLCRRERCLFLNARSASDMAPAVADIMQQELGWSDEHKTKEIAAFQELAKNYIPRP